MSKLLNIVRIVTSNTILSLVDSSNSIIFAGHHKIGVFQAHVRIFVLSTLSICSEGRSRKCVVRCNNLLLLLLILLYLLNKLGIGGWGRLLARWKSWWRLLMWLSCCDPLLLLLIQNIICRYSFNTDYLLSFLDSSTRTYRALFFLFRHYFLLAPLLVR